MPRDKITIVSSYLFVNISEMSLWVGKEQGIFIGNQSWPLSSLAEALPVTGVVFP